MKYLDSLIAGIRWIDLDTAILLIPTGDPTFLHPDFKSQPVVNFLQKISKPVYIDTSLWAADALGAGWSWDDYSEYYMAERSAFPAYGNVIRWHQSISKKENPQTPADTIDRFLFSEPEINWPVSFAGSVKNAVFKVVRDRDKNAFSLHEGGWKDSFVDVPYITHGVQSAITLIKDSVDKDIRAISLLNKNLDLKMSR